MSKQRRWIQVAVRALSGKGSGAIGPLEKAKNSTNNVIQQRHGIPNAVQLGHTLPFLNGGNDRSAEGTPIAWPGLCIAPHALPNRGSIVEICSPGLMCRNAASQVALAESRLGRVLWLSVGAFPEVAASCGLDGVRNLTLQPWPITSAADSRAALQRLLEAVRSQAYSLVVLDHVAGLAPPLPTSTCRHVLAPAAVAPAGAEEARGAVQAGAAPGLGGIMMGTSAAAAAVAGTASGCQAVRVNMKFLHHILPVLLEDTLSQLASSSGPDLATTTLLLNTYSRPEQAWFSSLGGAGCAGDRSRWARRAVVRHVSATLHLLPDGPGAGFGGLERGNPGGGGAGGRLHAVLTRGTLTGEDGSPCFMGSLKLPV